MIDWILIGVVLIWLTAATISDIKTKEVPDWLNFSLIAIGLAIFATKSILEQSYWPILHSLLYVGIFLIIGNIMYYTKQWGGGDAKLLIGIGAILPVYPSLLRNFFNSELTINLPVTILINLIIVGCLWIVLDSFSHNKTQKFFLKGIQKNKAKKETIKQSFTNSPISWNTNKFYCSERTRATHNLFNNICNSINYKLFTNNNKGNRKNIYV